MSPSGRPRDAEATRAAIRTAARDLFAAGGYERTTIRAVAAAAGIDKTLVMRYFGNKEGLLAAAADFDLRMPDLSAVPPDTVGRRMAAHFLDRWEEDESFTALLRAAASHEVARDRLLDVVAVDVAAATAAATPDRESVPVRVGLIAAQVLGVALCRYVLRMPPVVDMPRDELVAWLGATLQRYLTGDRPVSASGTT